nr:2-dehydropantoate 2-reductase N-terminal domain-containing protein [Sanguibacter massiliensis]
MRVLVVGAGATGGVLGARLVRAGTNVTFLVREQRRVAEAEAVVTAAGHPVPLAVHHATVRALTAEGSAFTPSLYRGVVAGREGETEHVLGAFQTRAREHDV